MEQNTSDQIQIIKLGIILSKVCYVDEVLTNKKNVTYIAFETKNVGVEFETFNNIRKYFRKNINLIKDDHIRKLSYNMMKASHLEMVGVNTANGILKTLIVKNEIHAITRYKSGRLSTELQNRKAALKELIDKTQCKQFIVDNYSNKELKIEITKYAKTKKKTVIFAISSEYQGLMLADIFLRLY